MKIVGNFIESLKNLGGWRLAAIGGGGLFVLGLIIFLVTRLSNPNYELLFGNLDLTDTNTIVSRLKMEKIPYEIRHDGSEIWVPQDKKLALRVEMAEQQIPSNSNSVSIGYELFDKGDMLGSTSFVQNINLMRAMEGELARTIHTIQGVKTARVHLVLPKREVFSRETQEPSASIVLKMEPNHRLTALQVQAIQRLVASSVPKLKPTHVSIIDEKGGLLTRGSEDEKSVIVQQAYELKIATEQRLRTNIEELLERSLGPDKVRADVSVEMDMDHIATTKEIIDPESKVERSHQTNEENEQQLDSENSSVSVSQNLPDAGTNSNPGARSQSKKNSTNEVVNYEFSKTTTNLVRDTAAVKRITAAVLVDGNYGPPANGEKKLTYIALDEKSLEQMTALVRNTIGYDAQRGDQVQVSNLPFAGHDIPDTMLEDDKKFFGFDKEFIQKSISSFGLSIIAILFVFFFLKPMISKSIETFAYESITPEGQAVLSNPNLLQAGGGLPSLSDVSENLGNLEELIDIDKVEGRVKASSIRKISEIVDKHPEEALSIIRFWMYADE
jgi:flagellar M-ring protein FliF